MKNGRDISSRPFLLAGAALLDINRDFKDVDHSGHLLCFLVTLSIERLPLLSNGRWSDFPSFSGPKKDGGEMTEPLHPPDQGIDTDKSVKPTDKSAKANDKTSKATEKTSKATDKTSKATDKYPKPQTSSSK
ncbi:hypothetical protein [Halobacillus trueperi]|uniref:Uncharacterized protein n=1 Tax=Halobacillus trueperi TaxID=156205 RepID=A0A3E0JE10_9BACI|nr:hypothetical protein [Halobacillus trueperi]REJ11193.1 hypothetical protein DYE48_02005 [Halobacillus trueperi]